MNRALATPHRSLQTRFLRSVIAGAVTAVLETGVFVILFHRLHWLGVVSNVAAFCVGTVLNFSLSKLWVFHKSGRALHREMVHFGIIALVGLGLNAVIFSFFFWLTHRGIASNILTMGLLFLINFMLKQWVFSSRTQRQRVHRLWRLYGGLGIWVRLKLFIRWHTCPIELIVREVPSQGALLDIGCGRGLLSFWALILHPDLKVHGIDIDAAKIADAGQVAQQLTTSPTFTTIPPYKNLPAGPWDCIAIADVLYLMAAEKQRELLEWCALVLAPGGKLLIKEMSSQPRWKFTWNKFQENLSVKLFKVTKGEQTFCFTPPEIMMTWLQKAGLSTHGQRLDQGYVHPHYLIIAKRTG